MRCNLLLILMATLLGIAPSYAGQRVRIVTLNAEWLVYDEGETASDPWGSDYTIDEHYERIAGIIETLEPDIVNLVEVTTKDGVEYLVDVLHAKGLADYAGYHIGSNDSGTGQDIAVVTKLEPKQVENKRIRKFYSRNMSGDWREEYSWQTASGLNRSKHTSVSKNAVYYFSINGHDIGLLGMHLKAFPDSPSANAQRSAQSRIAQKIILQEIVGRGYTPIVLGDLNDYDPDVADRDNSQTQTDVLSNLKDYDPNAPGPELVNVAEKIAREYDRYTAHWDQDHDRVPDEGEPMTMIDHVLIHKSLMPSVTRVFIDHGHGGQTTDHWPVVVDLELN